MNRHDYLQKRERRESLRQQAGLLSERFPGIATIALDLTYRQRPAGPALMKRTMNYYSDTYALFRMDCVQDGCAGGGFDLTDVVDSLVKDRKASGKGRLTCAGSDKLHGFGHMSLSYEVTIRYLRTCPPPAK